MSEIDYRLCNKCVMDTTDPDILFDEKGVCHHCTTAEGILNSPPHSWNEAEKADFLDELVKKVKLSSRGLKYDVIIGVSGGVDSTYLAYKIKELGLTPLAVHLDNGWNTEISTKNIENCCNILGIDLYTHVINWDEFKDLQLSFLRASTPDSEIPSDHAIVALMFQQAKKEHLKYILAGYNFASECIQPAAWSRGHHDWKYIKSVQKIFGHTTISSFPHLSYPDFLAMKKIHGIKIISLLNYLNFDKEEAKKKIIEKLGWHDYGAKHHESFYTKFFQTYILPIKFGYDKRRAHFSSLIVSGQMTRGEALELLKASPFDVEQIEQDIKYIINKLEITRIEFDEIMKLPKKTIFDYPNYYKFERLLRKSKGELV